MARFSRVRWTALGALALAACNDPPTAPLPDQLVVTRAPGTVVGAPGFQLMDTIFVRVLDAAGRPRVGVPVTWGVRDGGGSVLPLSDVSGSDGTTAAVWTLGPKPGYNELRVSINEESSYTFTATGEVFRASEVVSDFYRGCGLVGGAIWCWGRNAPVIGVPASNYDSASPSRPAYGTYYNNIGPALFDNGREYTDLAYGYGGSICALDIPGDVWCAFRTARGEFLSMERVVGFPPLVRGSLTGWSWNNAPCGLAESDGSVWCLKDGSVAAVPGTAAFTVLRLDETGLRSCGLLADSAAACWGAGPLGDGTSTSSPTPVTVSGGHRFVDLVVGSSFGCGRTAGGELWCWGQPQGSQSIWLEPALIATNVTLAGATYNMLLISRLGGGLSRVGEPAFPPLGWNQPLDGLEHVKVSSLPEGAMGCVSGVEGEVYCVEEMWNSWTGIHISRYFPVMPVRQAPPLPAVLR